MLSKATADPSAARQDDSVSDGEAGVCEVAAGGARPAVLDGWSPTRKLPLSQPPVRRRNLGKVAWQRFDTKWANMANYVSSLRHVYFFLERD
jgi:hypothetical protein